MSEVLMPGQAECAAAAAGDDPAGRAAGGDDGGVGAQCACCQVCQVCTADSSGDEAPGMPPRRGGALLRRSAVAALLASQALPARAKPREKPPQVPRTELNHPCSRTVSRNVRKQLDTEVLKPAMRAGVAAWPSGCPLDPVRDLYGWQEKNKTRKRGSGNFWTCGYCGKKFKNEHYLDLHLERKHVKDLPVNGVCLADYCEVFEVCHGEARFKRTAKDSACNNETLAEVRRRCETAMAKCFPLGEEKSRKLNAQLSKTWCRTIDCAIRAEQRMGHHSELMPVIVILIFIVLICFIFFSIVVCCVDYSDDIIQWLADSGALNARWARRLIKARDTTRAAAGVTDRTREI